MKTALAALALAAALGLATAAHAASYGGNILMINQGYNCIQFKVGSSFFTLSDSNVNYDFLRDVIQSARLYQYPVYFSTVGGSQCGYPIVDGFGW